MCDNIKISELFGGNYELLHSTDSRHSRYDRRNSEFTVKKENANADSFDFYQSDVSCKHSFA